jgi:hypothetical protein
MLTANSLVFALGMLLALVIAAPTPIGHNQVELNPRALKKHSLLPESHHLLKKLNQKISPPRDKAVFWSGTLHGGKSSIEAAEAYAKKHGKQTVEMAVAKAGIHIPDNHPDESKLWKHASKLWATRAKGKTEAILGHAKQRGVYKTIEKPALMKNKKVTQHVEHNLLAHPPKQRTLIPKASAKAQKSSKPSARQKTVKKILSQKAKAASPKAKSNGAKWKRK